MKFYVKKKYLYKTFQVATASALITLGVYVFINGLNLITSFKPYYFYSYKYAMLHKINNLAKFADTRVQKYINAAQIKSDLTTSRKAESVPVITYHGIISDKVDNSNVTIKQFADQMTALKKEGWQTVSLKDYYEFAYKGKDLPEKSFLLTFDDGRKDAYYPADPILQALDYRAVMFVITDEMQKNNSKYYLNNDEVKQMQQNGRWEIEVHTKSGHALVDVDSQTQGHYFTNKMWLKEENRFETEDEYRSRISYDLTSAKNDIKSLTGHDSIAMALPYGDIGESDTNFPRSTNILTETLQNNFEMVFIQFHPGRDGSANYSGSDSKFNKRIEVSIDWTGSDLVSVMNTSLAKRLPYVDDFRVNNGWINAWGNKYFGNNTLIVRPLNDLSSSSIYLDGTRGWRNYLLSYTALIPRGTTLKQTNMRNGYDKYLSCNYSESTVSLEVNIFGTRTILASKNNLPVTDQEVKLATQIVGSQVKCFLNGAEIVSGDISGYKELQGGQIGFEVVGNNDEVFAEIKNLRASN